MLTIDYIHVVHHLVGDYNVLLNIYPWDKTHLIGTNDSVYQIFQSIHNNFDRNLINGIREGDKSLLLRTCWI